MSGFSNSPRLVKAVASSPWIRTRLPFGASLPCNITLKLADPHRSRFRRCREAKTECVWTPCACEGPR